jgi:hypothetical protein
VAATRGHLEALTSRLLSGIGGSKKRKINGSLRDAAEGTTLEQAPGRSSAPKRGRGGDSAQGKAA